MINGRMNLDRYARLQVEVGELILRGARKLEDIESVLQDFVDNPKWAKSALISMFEFVANLGVITVPEDYVHETQMERFKVKHGSDFRFFSDWALDKNFPDPSHVMRPGEKFSVEIFKWPSGMLSDGCINFLNAVGASMLGVQGASLVWEQKRDHLPRDYNHASLDEQGRLWVDDTCRWRLPMISLKYDHLDFGLGYFNLDGPDVDTLLCFKEVK